MPDIYQTMKVTKITPRLHANILEEVAIFGNFLEAAVRRLQRGEFSRILDPKNDGWTGDVHVGVWDSDVFGKIVFARLEHLAPIYMPLGRVGLDGVTIEVIPHQDYRLVIANLNICLMAEEEA